jgi:hypothetical protein
MTSVCACRAMLPGMTANRFIVFRWNRKLISRRARVTALALVMVGLAVQGARAQGQGRGRGAAAGPPPTARASAPKDFTGYWVSIVTEHWHLRMLVPPKGDYSMLPLNPEARKIADSWDISKAKADADQCKAYGPPALMRVPGRLHLHWTDDNTLQLDTDSGTQTRTFKFGGAAPAEQAPQLQGYSAASWDFLGARGRGGVSKGTGQLRVRTTNMSGGYLRRNGVPYSESATLEEYFDTFTEPNGDTWLIVTAIVTDPKYLTQQYTSTVPFKKIPDRQGWDPTPCKADEAR